MGRDRDGKKILWERWVGRDRAQGGGGFGGFELGAEISGGTLESPQREYATTLARGKLSALYSSREVFFKIVVRDSPIKCTCCMISNI